MTTTNTKNLWISLFIITQLLLIVLHISKQSMWVKMSYTTQKYEYEFKKLHEQKKIALHQLYELQNPGHIKKYAQEHLGMQPLKRSHIRRIPSHAPGS